MGSTVRGRLQMTPGSCFQAANKVSRMSWMWEGAPRRSGLRPNRSHSQQSKDMIGRSGMKPPHGWRIGATARVAPCRLRRAETSRTRGTRKGEEDQATRQEARAGSKRGGRGDRRRRPRPRIQPLAAAFDKGLQRGRTATSRLAPHKQWRGPRGWRGAPAPLPRSSSAAFTPSPS